MEIGASYSPLRSGSLLVMSLPCKLSGTIKIFTRFYEHIYICYTNIMKFILFLSSIKSVINVYMMNF